MEEDWRGLEWYYLASLCWKQRGEVIATSDHDRGWCVSRDEQKLATVVDGSIVVVDLKSDVQSVVIENTLQATESIGELTFSPSGEQLAFKASNEVTVVNLSTNETFHVNGAYGTVAFSPDGRWGANSTHSDHVQVWNSQSGEVAWSKPRQSTGFPHILQFSPDSQYVITATNTGKVVEVWNVSSGRREVIAKPASALSGAVFIDNRSFLVCGEKGVELFQFTDGRSTSRQKIRIPSTRYVASIALSADKTRIALGLESNAAEVWDLNTGDLLWRQARTSRVRNIRLLNQGNHLLLESDGVIEICGIDGRKGEKPSQPVRIGWPDRIAISGEQILVAGVDREFLLWNPGDPKDSGSSIDAIRPRDKNLTKLNARSIAISPDGAKIATARERNDVQIWEKRTGQLVRRIELSAQTDEPSYDQELDEAFDLAYSPDGRWLAIASSFGPVLWDLEQSEIAWRNIRPRGDAAATVKFSHNGKRLNVGGGPWTAAGRLSIWNLSHEIPRLEKEFDHPEIVLTIAISPDERWLVAGDYSGLIGVYDLRKLESHMQLRGHSMAVQSFTFSPDGRTLLSGGYNGRMKLWQVGA